MRKKPKLIKVVTNGNAYQWHIASTIDKLSEKYEIIIIGNGVSKYKETDKSVTFIDILIERKPSPLRDLYTLFVLIFLFLRIKPDVIHSLMPKSGLLSSISGFITRVPIRIHTFTGQVWANKKGFSRFMLKTFDKLICYLNTICLTDSNSQSKFLFDQGISDNNKLIPILNKGSVCGVNISKINTSIDADNILSIKKKYSIAENDFVFSFIARKTREKGAIDVLEAFNTVCEMNSSRSLKLFYIGPYEDDIKKEVVQLISSNHIIDLGLTNNIYDYLALTDVLCLPSYREGFGNIIIDAGALRVPSLGYNIAGLSDSIKNNKTGIVSEKGNIKHFVANMNRLLQDEALVSKLGNNAFEHVKDNFDSDVLSEAYDEFYNQLINSSMQS
jgi:glycosyltransferase involved in cell wall biosynthesis|tara:strand:+ start:1650 stop:2810 length:1161 start_codon:yes stop_codon:yes gene_type:complete